MKKVLLAMSAALVSLAAMATDYVGTLNVVVNGAGTKQPAAISVVENSGKYVVSLNNFILVDGETIMPVGNIVVDNITGGTAAGVTTLYAEKSVTITAGDMEGVASDQWIGPMLGEVPLKMSVRFNADGYAAAKIDISLVGMEIVVNFDNLNGHYQMPNGDFEESSTGNAALTGKPNNAPRHWHGFESAKGTFKTTVSNPDKLNMSDDVRPGSAGVKSAVITSTKILFVVANGTMTNGILNAGNLLATHTDNHAETSLTDESLDDNGDSFNTPIYAKPDAVKCWLKFSQATASSSYPYASFNAVLTDGTYYQDPQDQTYTNVAAVAKPDNSLMTVGDWRELTVPFDYASYSENNADAKAILLTISTNATPAKGSSGDKVWVDDLELVYNADLTNVTYKGTNLALDKVNEIEIAADETVTAADFSATVNGASATVTTVVEEIANGYQAVVTAVSGDLMTANTCVARFTRQQAKGDVNNDGKVDVSDVTTLIQLILNSTEGVSAADVDGDGKVNIADVTALIYMILNA